MIKEGIRKEKPVVIAGISEEEKEEERNLEGTSRLAWSKVPVTITSLASVCGLFISRRERFNRAEMGRTRLYGMAHHRRMT